MVAFNHVASVWLIPAHRRRGDGGDESVVGGEVEYEYELYELR